MALIVGLEPALPKQSRKAADGWRAEHHRAKGTLRTPPRVDPIVFGGLSGAATSHFAGTQNRGSPANEYWRLSSKGVLFFIAGRDRNGSRSKGSAGAGKPLCLA